MAQIQQLNDVLTEWITKIGATVLPKMNITSASQIGKIMNGFFGIDLNTYNVWKELGFLMKPTINSFVAPMLNKYLAVIPEEKLKATALEYATAMVDKAEETGYVNLFGIQVGKNAFEDLKAMIEEQVED